MKVIINFLPGIINILTDIIHHRLGIMNNLLGVTNHPLEKIGNTHLERGKDPQFQETTEMAQLEDLVQDLHLHPKEQQQIFKTMVANQRVMWRMIR